MKKLALVIVCVSLFISANAQDDDSLYIEKLTSMSLKDLMETKITTASNTEEKLSEASATVIVIYKEDIQQRGYKELIEIYDDLPGMQMVRPYSGDTYYKNYMRGFRVTTGMPYLVMIDGIVQNSLFYNTPETAETNIPITMIEKIEVVYGPASVIYGANAFMGVINIITEKDKDRDGSYCKTNVSYGIPNFYLGNYSFFYKKDKLRMSLNAHYEFGNLNNRVNNNDYYWLKDEHYADKKLWGDYLSNPSVAPAHFSSPIRNRGFDARAYYGNTEVAFQYFKLESGLGTLYPGDKTPAICNWPTQLSNIYVRHVKDINDKVKISAMVRYRFDGVTNDAADLEGYNLSNDTKDSAVIGGVKVDSGQSVRVLQHATWQTVNWSISSFEDLQYKATKKLSFNLGIKYEYKNLQKGYYKLNSAEMSPDLVDESSSEAYALPTPIVYQYQRRAIWQDNGVYLQGKYTITENDIVNAGIRFDNNSIFGTSNTVRAGYQKHIGDLIAKIFYGQSYKEPAPRPIYGGWAALGSKADIKPEKSNTMELSISYVNQNFYTLLSGYYVQNTNTIVTYTGGAKNAGKRNVLGMDYHIQKTFKVPFLRQLKLWAYYSAILSEEETKFDTAGIKTGTAIIGDLAHHSIYFGTTSTVNKHISATLRGRHIGTKETVASNPIRDVKGYMTIDANIIYRNLLVKGLSLELKISNLLDTKYYHSGYADADAGETPGSWSGKAWNGSNGWYNSLLPQPGRMFMMSLGFDF